MVVCHCLALNDAIIAAVVGSDSPTVDAVVEACGAGSKCGACRPLIEELLGKPRSEVEVSLVSAR